LNSKLLKTAENMDEESGNKNYNQWDEYDE